MDLNTYKRTNRELDAVSLSLILAREAPTWRAYLMRLEHALVFQVPFQQEA